MPRPALTEEQRRETRRKIRRAAAELYAQNGLADISARAIAETAGVSVGTIYSYFENLTDLMQSLWKEPLGHFLVELGTIAEATPDPRKRLRRLLEAYVSFALKQDAVYRGAFLFIRPGSQEKPEPMDPEQDRLFSLLKDTVAAGQKAGGFRRGNSRRITQSLWAGLHGAIALPTNIDRLALEPPERAARHMVDLLMEWIEAP
ncbi:MAG: TetR/AcrR family transcriptional regulator [Pseudomonadota bacterium]